MRALILGASAGLGRELGRAMAARGHDLVLVARDALDLEAEAAHLRLTCGVDVVPLAADARIPGQLARAVEQAFGAAEGFDAVLCPLGASRDDDDATLGAEDVQDLVAVNLLAIMAVLGLLLPGMRRRGAGSIVAFSSIAAARGRSRNVVYAAAKRGLESYCESLRHSLSDTGVRVQCYQLGYMDTQQAYGQRLALPKADPAAVARRVVARLDRDIGLVSAPSFWWPITLVLRLLPWVVFRRLRF